MLPSKISLVLLSSYVFSALLLLALLSRLHAALQKYALTLAAACMEAPTLLVRYDHFSSRSWQCLRVQFSGGEAAERVRFIIWVPSIMNGLFYGKLRREEMIVREMIGGIIHCPQVPLWASIDSPASILANHPAVAVVAIVSRREYANAAIVSAIRSATLHYNLFAVGQVENFFSRGRE